ncbi:transposase domain-containing protein [Caballeronia udeis]
MYPLIGTARLNGIEPYAWIKRTLEQLPSYPAIACTKSCR